MINEFPTLTTENGYSFPKINAAIMIAGGSYRCYDYTTFRHPPQNYLPCARPFLMCCPVNQTEDNYDSGKYTNHPPVLLLQGAADMNAPDEASKNYFSVLAARGDTVYKVIGPKIREQGTTGRHGVYTCQIPAVLGFLNTYLG